MRRRIIGARIAGDRTAIGVGLVDLPGAAGSGRQVVVARQSARTRRKVAGQKARRHRRCRGHVRIVVAPRGLGHGEAFAANQP